MANHVTNELTANGASDEVRRFFTAINGGIDEDSKPLLIDFNKIKPMPESLNIESSDHSEAALDYYVIELIKKRGSPAVRAALGDYAGKIMRRLPGRIKRPSQYSADEMPGVLKFGAKIYNNILNHGAPTWYEWRNKNWGTKWNAYNQIRLNDKTIRFDTAWRGVPMLLQELSARFPDITLQYAYADEQRGYNAGEYTFRGGEVDYDFVPENGSSGAGRISNNILGSLDTEGAPDVEDEWEDEM